MTFASGFPAFPIHPTLLPAAGAPAAWAPEELASFDDLPLDDAAAAAPAAPAGPSAEELRAVEEARREAAERAERDRVQAEAYAAGLAAGEAAGRAAESARVRSLVAAAEDALDRLRAGESRWTGLAEENLCALATAIARQVIGRELAGDAAALTDLVRRALAEFPIDQPVVIRVHPADLATLASTRAGGEGAGADVAPNRETRWVADPVLVPGGCVVEGRERIVDGRVDMALERLYRKLSGTNA